MICLVYLTADTLPEAEMSGVKLVLTVLVWLTAKRRRAAFVAMTGEGTGHCKYLPLVAYGPCQFR